MTKEEWKETDLYKQSVFYTALGKLLANPKSKIDQFTALGREHGMNADIVFRIIENTVTKAEEE